MGACNVQIEVASNIWDVVRILVKANYRNENRLQTTRVHRNIHRPLRELNIPGVAAAESHIRGWEAKYKVLQLRKAAQGGGRQNTVDGST